MIQFNILSILLSLLPFTLLAGIIQINSLSQVTCDSPPSTLYFFDIDDTLIDSPSMLGSKAWRRSLINSVPDELIDTLTLFVAQHYPVDAVEGYASCLIEKLQKLGFGVFGLTARERNIWYYTPIEGVDALTIAQLKSAEIYLDSADLEKNYPSLIAAPEYYEGVFFADIEQKGTYLTKLFQISGERPAKVVFIDDKFIQAESVAQALDLLGIENECYWYTRTDSKPFHPLIASIQLFYLWFSGGKQAISDVVAAEIAELNPEKSAEDYLAAVLEALSYKDSLL